MCVCVWGTAATGVTIDRRQSSPHSNSSAVPSKTPAHPPLWHATRSLNPLPPLAKPVLNSFPSQHFPQLKLSSKLDPCSLSICCQHKSCSQAVLKCSSFLLVTAFPFPGIPYVDQCEPLIRNRGIAQTKVPLFT